MDRIIYEDSSKIKQKYWGFLDEEWKIKEDIYKHRTKLQNVKLIEKIKIEIQKKGY